MHGFFAPAAPTRPITQGLRPFDPQLPARWGLVAQFPAPLKKQGLRPVLFRPERPEAFQGRGELREKP
ncbi:hypothetical protein, partial [Streptomyces sp. MB09-02B]|uniref:hypothetical protein n=1 Tax=Streptomyces sp. MB09-02B TaxID=3028667 RepID=UPI0029AFC145